MEEYTNIGVWFACIFYAASAYGWFIGIPLGVLIGSFLSIISFFIAIFIWPLILAAIAFIAYSIYY